MQCCEGQALSPVVRPVAPAPPCTHPTGLLPRRTAMPRRVPALDRALSTWPPAPPVRPQCSAWVLTVNPEEV